MRSLLAGLALCLGTVAANAADAPTVTGTVSKTEVTLGERFTVELRGQGPPGTVWTFPAELSDEQAEMRALPASASAAPVPGAQRYNAAVFALGEVHLPTVDVKYRLPDGGQGAVAAAPLTVRVLSVLPKDPKEQKLADIRGPMPLAIGRAFWVALGAAGLLILALVLWIVRRRRRAVAPRPAEPEIAPDVAALQALELLAASGLLQRGDYRLFYIELTAIAKGYLERRLAAPILEMTSTETVSFLRDHLAGRDLAGTVRDISGAADRIKFARSEGLSEEAQRHLASVRTMVGVLEEKLRPKVDVEKVA